MYQRWVNLWVIHERYDSEETSVWARGFQGVWYPVSCTFCSPVTARRATVRKKWEWKYTNWESSGAHSTCPFLINYDCLLLLGGGLLFLFLNNSGKSEKQTARRREGGSWRRGKDRDWETHEETATGDWVTQIFARSLTAGNPSLGFLQLYLLLRKEQIMTRGWSMRYKV